MPTLFEQAERAPATWVVAFAYLAMALVTNPLEPSNEALVHWGAAIGLLVADGEPWRLVTHAFLHGGLMHLAFNTWALLVIGPALESIVRTWRFALIYLLSALGGGIAGCLWHSPLTPLVGGSGALFGMLGALVAINMRNGRHLFDFLNYHGPKQLVVLIALNLGLGLLLPMVSNAAHLGGLVTGFVLMFVFLDRGRSPADFLTRVIQAGWIALLLSLLFYVMHPVLRFDYLTHCMAQARTQQERIAYARAIEAEVPRELLQAIRQESPIWDQALRRWQQ